MTIPVPPPLPDIQAILKTPPSQLPRNKQAEELHNHEVLVQIYLPMLVGVLLIVVVGVLIGLALSQGDTADVRLWADVSTIFVILQVLAGLLPVLLLIGGLAGGLFYVLRKLPPYFKVAQDYSVWLAYKTKWAMKFVLEPVVQVKSSVSGLDGFIKGLRKFFKR
jgi:NADH:ubiquinone oxidoreductase subunit 5 (subunit L)/multisubunit Na+/H+ antiporter MnhA subunit